MRPITPKFVKALGIDIAIIFIALSVLGFFYRMDFITLAFVPFAIVYAIVHTGLELAGVG